MVRSLDFKTSGVNTSLCFTFIIYASRTQTPVVLVHELCAKLSYISTFLFGILKFKLRERFVTIQRQGISPNISTF